jgi:hypothetical protein
MRRAVQLLLALALVTTQVCAAADAPPKPARAARGPHGGMPDSARVTYELLWGVDQMTAKLTQADELIRFTYRVVDPRKAKPLHDRAATPQLFDERAHAVLQVPVMDKVGPLRQSTPPEYGKVYWMAFSNKGKLVQAGHRVSVVIGPFRVDGLIVQP